jgi:hypothetical protein
MLVIPAQAGIQNKLVAVPGRALGSGLRRNDKSLVCCFLTMRPVSG